MSEHPLLRATKSAGVAGLNSRGLPCVPPRTYGDEGGRHGAGLVNMGEGDVLGLCGALRQVHRCEHKLICALLGMYVVQEVAPVASVPREQWYENAHVRKTKRGETDLVVRAE